MARKKNRPDNQRNKSLALDMAIINKDMLIYWRYPMFRNNKLRYIKCILIIIFCLFFNNIRILAGEKAWIFVDEIIVK